MLDCGIHPAYSGLSALPFFDEIDPGSVDLILISHFHLDHAASLPYFTERTNFKGKIYMTHPTKAIFKWILADFVRVSGTSHSEELPFKEQDLFRCYDRIIAVDFHQQIEHEGIKFTAYNAGHVLGAAMFLVEIAGVRILYTGDYSREEDRHLMCAERPPSNLPIDVLICESTYGVQSHMPRPEREKRFTSLVHNIVGRGGRCLLPVFALGRAQELLLMLDEYWQEHAELHNIPIYFASSLAKKCITIYQTYINMMNERIKKQFAISNPFIFKHVSTIRSIEQFDDVGPCVMLASPGMLQSGLSRELFELWCPNKKNGCIVAGFCVEGTLAKQVLSEPSEVTAMSGAKIPLRMSVDYISFSAHVDFLQNSQFIEEISAPYVVFVHGEVHEMTRLRNAMSHRYEQRFAASTAPDSFAMSRFYCPKNCETVTFEFRGEKFARVIGEAASSSKRTTLHPGTATACGGGEPECVQGILVGKDFEYEIVDASELSEFTNICLTSIKQQQTFSCSAPFSLLEYHITQLFGKGNVQRTSANTLVVMSSVLLEDLHRDNLYLLSWAGNAVHDMIADAVAAISIHAEISRASIKMTKQAHDHHHHHHNAPTSPSIDIDVVLKYLLEHFESVSVDEDQGKFVIDISGIKAFVDIESMHVECEDEEQRRLVEKKLEKLTTVFQIIQ